MKQITPEIKAKIFALYYGQDICYWPTSFESPLQRVIITDYTMRNAWLMVKPLSSITDEDAIWVGELNQSIDPVTHMFVFNGRDACIRYVNNNIYFLQHDTKTADYLRSKGYALPYMNWSVSDLVAAGVFKLKEVNNE